MDEFKKILESYLENRTFRFDDEQIAQEIVQDIMKYVEEVNNNGIYEVDNGHSSTSEA